MSAYNDMLNIIMSRQTGLLFVAFVLVAVAITLLVNRSEKENLTSETPPAVYKIDRNWCNSCKTTSMRNSRRTCAELARFSMHGFGNYACGFAGGLCCWKAWLLVGWAAGGFCCWQACRQYYNYYCFILYSTI